MSTTWHNETPYPLPQVAELKEISRAIDTPAEEILEHIAANSGPFETEILGFLDGAIKARLRMNYSTLETKLTEEECSAWLDVVSCLEHARARIIVLFEIQSGKKAPEGYID